jgi:hypothetical protein
MLGSVAEFVTLVDVVDVLWEGHFFEVRKLRALS